MHQLYIAISSAILFGLRVFIPILFIVRLVKWRPRRLKMEALIIAFNILILITGILYLVDLLTMVVEYFKASYSGVEYEQYAFINRATGPYWWAYWSMIFVNILLPNLMWFKKIRASVKATYAWFCCAMLIACLEYFPIIITSMHRDYIPSSFSSVLNGFFFSTLFDGLISLMIFLGLLWAIYDAVERRRQLSVTTAQQ